MVKRSIAVSGNHLTATGNHMPYGITQCYLPPGSGDFPAFTPAEAGTRFSDSGGMQGWIDLELVAWWRNLRVVSQDYILEFITTKQL